MAYAYSIAKLYQQHPNDLYGWTPAVGLMGYIYMIVVLLTNVALYIYSGKFLFTFYGFLSLVMEICKSPIVS